MPPRFDEAFPSLPYASWVETKETLHRFSQIVGKLRMAASAPQNHWWHVPLLVNARGTTTGPIRDGGTIYEISLDFVAHELVVATVSGEVRTTPLPGRSVAEFYAALVQILEDLGIDTQIAVPVPFDMSDTTPFAEDLAHSSYDVFAVRRYHQVLAQVDNILREMAGRYRGKVSPVNHFWHTFDLAQARFSGRPADPGPGEDADPVTREAYDAEVISFGFWFGDDKTPNPAFYSYTAPEPAGLADESLAPEGASWIDTGNGHLAVLDYELVRQANDPRAVALVFYESAYRAGHRAAGWADAPGVPR